MRSEFYLFSQSAAIAITYFSPAGSPTLRDCIVQFKRRMQQWGVSTTNTLPIFNLQLAAVCVWARGQRKHRCGFMLLQQLLSFCNNINAITSSFNLDESKSSLLLERESSYEPVLPLFKSLSPFKVKCNCPGHVSCSFLQSESSLLSNVGLLWPPIFPSTVSATESEKKVSFRGGHAESCSNRCCSLL